MACGHQPTNHWSTAPPKFIAPNLPFFLPRQLPDVNAYIKTDKKKGVNRTAVQFICAVSAVAVAVTPQSCAHALAFVTEKLGLCTRPVHISYINNTHHLR